MKKTIKITFILGLTFALVSCNKANKQSESESDYSESEHVHTMIHVAAVESTCIEQGNIEYYYCLECLRFYSDEQGTNELSSSDIQLPLANHKLTHIEEEPSTCIKNGVMEHYHCEVCGKDFSDERGTTELSSSDIQLPLANHKLVHIEETPATCTSDGIKEHYHCEVCEKDFSDENGTEEMTSVIDASKGHFYVLHSAVEPTLESYGNIEYYSCEHCEKLFVLENEEYVEISKEEVIIPKLLPKDKTSFDFDGFETEGKIVVSSTNNTDLEMVEDESASDGKALRGSQQIANPYLSGISLTFIEPLDITLYSQINFYVKTESFVHTGFYINDGTQVYNWGQYEEYTAINVKPYIQSEGVSSLTSIFIGDTDRTGYWFIDKIELVEIVYHDYDFSSLDDNDADMMSGINVTLDGIVDDVDASNGFAYKFVTPASCWDHRGVLSFDNAINPTDYEAIIVVMKTSIFNILISADDVFASGTFVLVDGEENCYHEYNILENEYIKSLGSISALYMVNGLKDPGQSTEVFIDKVVFVQKQA